MPIVKIDYTCPRCGYQTIRKQDITRHFQSSNICKSQINKIELTDEIINEVLKNKIYKVPIATISIPLATDSVNQITNRSTNRTKVRSTNRTNVRIDYMCPRCGYKSIRRHDMNRHFQSKNICKSQIDKIDLTDEIINEVLMNKIYKVPIDTTLITYAANNANLTTIYSGNLVNVNSVNQHDVHIDDLVTVRSVNQPTTNSRNLVIENSDDTVTVNSNDLTGVNNNDMVVATSTNQSTVISCDLVDADSENSTTMEKEYVYLLRTREFVGLNMPIYKIGRTKRTIEQRARGYTKGTNFICWLPVPCHCEVEKLLKAEFKSKFIYRADEGYEYFEGDVDEMIVTFTYVTAPATLQLKPAQAKYKRSVIVNTNQFITKVIN